MLHILSWTAIVLLALMYSKILFLMSVFGRTPKPNVLSKSSDTITKSVSTRGKIHGRITRKLVICSLLNSCATWMYSIYFLFVIVYLVDIFWYLSNRDLRLHKLVFEEDILPDGTEVAYYARGQVFHISFHHLFIFNHRLVTN